MLALFNKAKYILPILILLSFFYVLLHKKNSTSLQTEEASSNLVFEIWKKTYMQFKDNQDVEKIQIIRNGKIYKISDLNESQKELFKLMLLYKTKKDIRRFSDSLSGIDPELVAKIIRETDEKIVESKTKLYNLKGTETHEFDKFFLENLDVYFFN